MLGFISAVDKLLNGDLEGAVMKVTITFVAGDIFEYLELLDSNVEVESLEESIISNDTSVNGTPLDNPQLHGDSSSHNYFDNIQTINDHLVDLEHEETNIIFIDDDIELPNGNEVTGVFPVFDSNYEYIMPIEMYLQGDNYQFDKANFSLWLDIQEDPSLQEKLGLTTAEKNGLLNGETPAGFVWHHNQQPGVLQLVDEAQHSNTGHTGGRSLWGGGSEYR